jgi:hypothetical protein
MEKQRSYLIAVDVFGPELTEEVISILGEAKKVTFAPTHRQHNRSESQLPERLVDKCRNILDMKDHIKRRTVFFGHLRTHDGERVHALALAELGYPVNVIADALNYHSITLTRWKISAYVASLGAAVPKIEVEPDPDLIDKGFKRCQDLRPGEVKSDLTYYAKVGHAMETLKGKHVAKRVADLEKMLRKDEPKKSRSNRWS